MVNKSLENFALIMQHDVHDMCVSRFIVTAPVASGIYLLYSYLKINVKFDTLISVHVTCFIV